ncbi:MAG: AmmeMemoRadiSam system protein B [Planctomycetes bacterium]|nr:AmmeMemoRadiSam system protein B [Planctomycetota bacterium]
MLREPAVAGAFYPAEKDRLEAMLDSFVVSGVGAPGAVAALSPHAGYIYSGAAAGALFAAVDVPGTVVILGPNHRGIGARYGLYDRGAWQTPFGEAAVDEELADAIRNAAPFVESDTASHMHEHSIEVQVPFLQYRRGDVKIVPICIGEQNYGRLVELGGAIAAAAQKTATEVLVLASSDMTHYESAEEASRKDHLAIERMFALDEEGLWEVVGRYRISMCGVGPAVAAMAAARELGAAEGRLIKYTNSGDVTGDYREVVGYAAVAFVRQIQ